MELKLSNGLVVLIDDEDFESCTQFKWHCLASKTLPTKYAYCWNPYPKALLLHRFLMNPPEGKIVHHRDDNGLNCRRSNMLITTNSINQHFRTDVKGYHWENSRRKWKAMIMVDGKATYLGRFDSEEEAALAYAMAKAHMLPEIFGDDE